MKKLLISALIFIFTNLFIITVAYSEEKIHPQDIVKMFKNSMMHWNINYDNLERNKSGAACIPWESLNKKFLSTEIFIALGYGFNLYDLNIAKKAALEGCERMRKANKIEKFCKCEMILYNDEILVNAKNK